MKELKTAEEVKKELESKEPVAIFFYMTTCPHCQVMHEPWNELEKSMPDVKFEKVESEAVPSELGISGFPHFKMIKDGKEVASADGEMDKEELKGKLTTASGRFRSRRLTRRGRKRAYRSTRGKKILRRSLASSRGKRR